MTPLPRSRSQPTPTPPASEEDAITTLQALGDAGVLDPALAELLDAFPTGPLEAADDEDAEGYDDDDDLEQADDNHQADELGYELQLVPPAPVEEPDSGPRRLRMHSGPSPVGVTLSAPVTLTP